jgi:hypothetical protein
MVKEKIRNFKELFGTVKESNKEYWNSIKQFIQPEELSFNLRALTAQILWLFLLYFSGLRLVAVKNFLNANATVLIFLGIFSLLRIVIKNKLPSWVPNMIGGKIFYNFEIKFLNHCIGMLFLSHIILILLPPNFGKSLLKNKRLIHE